MKKLNKICLKQRYWGYCFHKECNQENKLQELMRKSYSFSFEDMTDKHWALGKKNWEKLKMIRNKALKITNKDIIYAQLDSGYSDNLELNLYLKFGDEERQVGSVELPIDFNLNCKWYEIDEVKGLIDDYLEDEEADYEVINYE